MTDTELKAGDSIITELVAEDYARDDIVSVLHLIVEDRSIWQLGDPLHRAHIIKMIRYILEEHPDDEDDDEEGRKIRNEEIRFIVAIGGPPSEKCYTLGWQEEHPGKVAPGRYAMWCQRCCDTPATVEQTGALCEECAAIESAIAWGAEA